jgi:bis(5'-nucleosyl)-tetraphosphatase (symmetrical)
MRWIIGDIQGCAWELERLLGEIRFRPGRDELWCLGDLVNRGPSSLAVLEIWQNIGGRGILGNHDIYALRVRAGRRPRKPDTLDRLFEAPEADRLLGELRASPVLVHLAAQSPTGRDAWIVHAGLHPQWSDLDAVAQRLNTRPHDDEWLEHPEVRFATGVRCCTESGKLWRQTGGPSDCPLPYRPWDAYYQGATLVVHGHWAQRGFYRNRRTMGLDSGCVYGGALTAWCQDEDRIVQVPSRRAYTTFDGSVEE